MGSLVNRKKKYHADNQAQSSREKNEQMHLIRNQGYAEETLLDLKLYGPAIVQYFGMKQEMPLISHTKMKQEVGWDVSSKESTIGMT